MQLKIVDFIKTHSNWEELLTSSPYNLTIKRDGKLVLFKYNQINSDFNEEICCEARGLILEEGTWKVVRMAFKKFFNIGESFAAQLDWDTAVASEKIDGSIISVFFYDGKWRIATNSTIDAFKAEISGIGPYKTFGDLFESVCPMSTFVHFDKNKCITFELVSPYTKVVIDYPKTKVYVLSVRDMSTLVEYSIDHLQIWADANAFATPQVYRLNNQADYRKLVEDMPEGHEGIVVRDANNNRVKIKTLLYFQMHRARNNGVLTLERAIDLILANDHAEFLSYFPEYTNYFNAVEAVIHGVIAIAQNWDTRGFKQEYEKEFSERVAKKQFAINMAQKAAKGLQALAYKCYDGRGVEWLNTLTAAQWARTFAHQFSMVKEADQ